MFILPQVFIAPTLGIRLTGWARGCVIFKHVKYLFFSNFGSVLFLPDSCL